MNILLPYKNFKECANVLHDGLLYRQVDNAQTLIKSILLKLDKITISKSEIKSLGYKELQTHPIFNFWWNNGRPRLPSLIKYYDTVQFELFNRGYIINNGYIKSFKNTIINDTNLYEHSPPETPKRITSGYRIMLLVRDKKYFKEKFPITYRKNKQLIKELKLSKEKYKFAKLLGIKINE